MPRKATKVKSARIRLRRNSYIRKLEPFATEWFKQAHPEYTTPAWGGSIVVINAFLSSEYKLNFRSTSMRRIKGEKIARQGSWSIRVDFFDSSDPKLFTLFCLKFAPTIVDKTWFVKR